MPHPTPPRPAPSTASTLTARIRRRAEQLGFFRTGIARAGPLPGAGTFDEWLAQGMQGEMAWMERQAPKRRDPSLVLEGVRSIVVVAMNYHTGLGLSGSPLRGRISRYAWGQDYHRVVRERLESLEAFIGREAPGSGALSYVDTGPVMEKVWGARSSLGWMGKHTNLITRELGSWFFVGVILTDLELDCDPPEEDYCGTCTRCIAACPTGAIVAPYVVDARLCISYLTIELRGPIPRRLRPLIGNRIFGCDDCQEVCPWNRFAARTEEPAFLPQPGNRMPELAPLAGISPEEFNRRFRTSPVRRAKRDGFVRNVVVALGNSEDPAAVPALARALSDASPLVRSHAAWALGRIATGDARRALEERRSVESDSEVLEEIALALGEAANRR